MYITGRRENMALMVYIDLKEYEEHYVPVQDDNYFEILLRVLFIKYRK